MQSTLIGRSGREYKRAAVLHSHPNKSELDIRLATSDNQFFVLKPVSSSVFGHLLEFSKEFGDNHHLRTHVDYNDKENVVIYEGFTTDVLSLVKNYPPLPLKVRKAILQEVGCALRDMHAKNWIHLDVKPDNVLVNWHIDKQGQFHLQKVALGDLDVALKLDNEKLFNHRIGNVMWRSPEGQLGKGVGKHSEVFSFGLLCFYVMTGVEWLHADFATLEVEPESVILFKLLSAFGPLPDALMKHVNDTESAELLKALWQAISEDETNESFDSWSSDTFPNLDSEVKRLILRMTNLDPLQRASMSDIMADAYWNLKDAK
ncbi:putative serine/threonine protein kinase [Pseudovirgaria hyperparasitica]|uniref:Putative serine/threonine protein kinase n=1 Tax=Pseudovirgaria hyperparasitica TaxID=470096 RepID=A0A6A6WDA0_9PEZI|nr:putative serine/threonine protein kinase [Pseudovirgaria hyperparasitica]KAF2760683.1 putative serine/threonine protein kinase [Pseudovirgaria hyperparasitica]